MEQSGRFLILNKIKLNKAKLIVSQKQPFKCQLKSHTKHEAKRFLHVCIKQELDEGNDGSKTKSPSSLKHVHKQKAQMGSTGAHLHAVSVGRVGRVQRGAYCDHRHSGCSAVDLDPGVKVLLDFPRHRQLVFPLRRAVILINKESYFSNSVPLLIRVILLKGPTYIDPGVIKDLYS